MNLACTLPVVLIMVTLLKWCAQVQPVSPETGSETMHDQSTVYEGK